MTLSSTVVSPAPQTVSLIPSNFPRQPSGRIDAGGHPVQEPAGVRVPHVRPSDCHDAKRGYRRSGVCHWRCVGGGRQVRGRVREGFPATPHRRYALLDSRELRVYDAHTGILTNWIGAPRGRPGRPGRCEPCTRVLHACEWRGGLCGGLVGRQNRGNYRFEGAYFPLLM